MAYEKKDNYPSFKVKGTYPPGSDKELGLDNEDLEKFSLANFNSIIKDNKLLLTDSSILDFDERGRPVELQFDDDTFTVYGAPSPDDELNELKNPLSCFIIRERFGDIKSIAWDAWNFDSEQVNWVDRTALDNRTNSRMKDIENQYDDGTGIPKYWPIIFKEFNTNNNQLHRVGMDGGNITDNDIIQYLQVATGDQNQGLPDAADRNYRGAKGYIPLKSGTDTRSARKRAMQIDVLNFYCLNITDGSLQEFFVENNQNRVTPNGLNNTSDMFNIHGYYEFYGLKPDKKILYEEGLAYIKEKNESFREETRFGPLELELDEILNGRFRNLVYKRPIGQNNPEGPGRGELGNFHPQNNGQHPNFFPNQNEVTGLGSEGYGEYWTHQVWFPRIFSIKTKSTPSMGRSTDGSVNLISLNSYNSDSVDPYPTKIPYNLNFENDYFNRLDLGTKTDDIANENWNPIPFAPSNNPIPLAPAEGIISTEYKTNKEINNRSGFDDLRKREWFKVGAPFFKIDEELILGKWDNIKNSAEYVEQDFIVDCVDANSSSYLLYYNNQQEEFKYKNTSYPLEVSLKVLIKDDENFTNDYIENNYNFTPEDFLYLAGSEDESNIRFENTLFYEEQISGSVSYDKHHYRYKVIQWGDEKILLTDNQIESTYFFDVYNQEGYPDKNNHSFKKLGIDQLSNFKPIGQEEITTHTYNTPGVKNIKIIVTRLTRDGSFILQTYLVTKNIVINDGLLSSQDFEIFGGTDFNFLPIVENQAIIGGFNVESKYDNSVSKIVKDDSFVQDDYLEKSSAKNYIEKINNGSLGKQPGQLDLGQVRVFKEARDIYDFIGGDKLNWIVSGSDTLPVNSLATDIFIRDNKCVVDLNPSDTEYSAIQNKAGLKEVGVVVGDYKVNQPQGGRIQKQGVMETPILDTDNEKQAF